jgi:hypothetical protein
VIREGRMTTQHRWQESYMAAVLETGWTKILERIQAAESEIRERQRVFSENHGGTADERQAIADAIRGMQILRSEAAEWQNRQVSRGDRPRSGTD